MEKKVVFNVVRRYELQEKICQNPSCGKAYDGVESSRYCSDRCRLQAAWHRNGPAYRERKKQAGGGGPTS